MSIKTARLLEQLEDRLNAKSDLLVVLTPLWAMGGKPTEADLTAPLDARGRAWLSPFWGAMILGGTAARRVKILADMRTDPQYQQDSYAAPAGATRICSLCGATYSGPASSGLCPDCDPQTVVGSDS